MALSCGPRIVIADEPTTALDVTIQAQILELMKSLTQERGVALIIITHNLGVVARYSDRVNVMYAGKIIERGLCQRGVLQPEAPVHHRVVELGAPTGPATQGEVGPHRGSAA